MSVDDGSARKEIADLQKRLADLDRERENVLGALEQLKRRAAGEMQPPAAQMVGVIASSRGSV